MSSNYGKNLKFSLLGESHGRFVGAVLDGFPAGYEIDNKRIEYDITRRSSSGKYGSGRNEQDILDILTGLNNGVTLGTPLTFLFKNADMRSQDYESIKNIIRPGHGDYTSLVRYGHIQSGGGHMSGRLTAPMTAAGSLCKQYLENKYRLKFMTKVVEFGGEKMKKPVDPTIEQSAEINLMYEKVSAAGDSCGAVIKAIVSNMPEGLGSPIFGNVESRISEIMFGIPGLKGISFGLGFDMAGLKGSESNDEFYIDERERVRTKTNNAGGILGGITTGMPLVMNLAFKPTPTIGTEQSSVNIEEMSEVKVSGKGRHDVSYALRVAPVIEAAASIALLDMFLERDGYSR